MIFHQRRAQRRSLLAALLAIALTCLGTLSGVIATAVPITTDPPADPPADPTTDPTADPAATDPPTTTGWGPHHLTTGRTLDGQRTWQIGSYISGSGQVAFCALNDFFRGPGAPRGATEFLAAEPRDELSYHVHLGGASPTYVKGEVDREAFPRLNYLMYFAQRSTDKYQTTVYRAAMTDAIGMWDNSYYNDVIGQVYDKDKFNADVARATHEAAQFSGPYTISVKLTPPKDLGKNGSVTLDIRSHAGTPVKNAAFPVHLAISGPAEFVDNGAKTLEVTAATTSVAIRALGPGTMSVSAQAKALPGDYLINYHQPIGQFAPRTQGLMSATEKSVRAAQTAPITPAKLSLGISTIAQYLQPESTGFGASVDKVTITSQGRWPQGEKLAVDMTLYGPFPTPYHSGAAIADDAPITGRQRLIFSEPGTLTTQKITLTAPGFYTWIARVDSAAQTAAMRSALDNTAYQSPFFEPAETIIAPATPAITTEVERSEILVGETSIDRITIDAIFADHGEFTGADPWPADLPEMTHRLYGPFSIRPTADTPLSDAPVVSTQVIPMTTSTHRSDPVPLDEPGWYVWVSSFPGDGRLRPVTTSAGDPAEQFQVFARSAPSVSTTAIPAADFGDPVYDIATISDPEDFFEYHGAGEQAQFALGFTAYQDASCTHPQFISPWQSITAAGEYRSAEFTPDGAGDIYWREALVHILDEDLPLIGSTIALDELSEQQVAIVAHGECGAPGETTTVNPPPPPKMPPTGVSQGVLTIGFAVIFVVSGTAFLIIRRNNRRHDDP